MEAPSATGKKKSGIGKIITRLISLGLIIIFFVNPKSYWPGAFLGIVMYMSIIAQFTGEQIKTRTVFERGGSWAIFVIGIVLSILLATLTQEIGIPSYKGLYQFLFCSQGVWGRTSGFEWQIIVIFTILTPSWFALDKSSVKEFFASMFFVLILLFVASKFVECEIPKGSLPEQLGITNYDNTDLVVGLDTDSTLHEEKKEIISPAVEKPIRFAKKWYLAGVLIAVFLFILYFLVKKEERDNSWVLFKWVLVPILVSTSTGWLASIAEGKWENFFHDITTWAGEIFWGIFLVTIFIHYCILILLWIKNKSNNYEPTDPG